MSGEERFDETLRQHGVSVDLERLGQAGGLAEVLALVVSGLRRAKVRGTAAAGLLQRVLQLWRREDFRPPGSAQDPATGLPRGFHECFASASLELRLVL